MTRRSDGEMSRKLRVLVLSACATLVAVAFWAVVIALNILRLVFGVTSTTKWVAWAIVIASAVGFFVVFFSHFSRTER